MNQPLGFLQWVSKYSGMLSRTLLGLGALLVAVLVFNSSKALQPPVAAQGQDGDGTAGESLPIRFTLVNQAEPTPISTFTPDPGQADLFLFLPLTLKNAVLQGTPGGPSTAPTATPVFSQPTSTSTPDGGNSTIPTRTPGPSLTPLPTETQSPSLTPPPSATPSPTATPGLATGGENEVVARPIDLTFTNDSISGNPFDIRAQATFSHPATGETRVTELFYMGGNEWRVRFTPTQAGEWLYHIESDDPDLDDIRDALSVTRESNLPGFVTFEGDQWVRTGGERAGFVPQFIMYAEPIHFYNDPVKVEADLLEFMDGHGFNGVHIPVYCAWFLLEESSCDDIESASPNPDLRTFEALELIITEVYNRGGTVHLWAWGDESRGQTPERWGYNGAVDQRLQRYIAARLGPLPGWTMGYGFDLWEWTTEEQLDNWHAYMHAQMGWPHLLGARAQKNKIDQLSEAMDYAGYEQHRPDYDKYVETILDRPQKPSFSEDRFRVRNEGRAKDYSLDDTRQGLWRSMMAGGIANIWGYLLDGGDHETGSAIYPNKEEIKRYFVFSERYFSKDLIRCDALSDAPCLRNPDHTLTIFYVERTALLEMDLSHMEGMQLYSALNTVTGEEISGSLTPGTEVLTLPTTSDWVILVGDF